MPTRQPWHPQPEKIQIGEDIVVSVLGIDSSAVKLGIEAPKNIRIFRWELYEQIQKENLASSEKQVQDVTQAAEWLKKILFKEIQQ
ncbi:MAG: carbon storage regulator [Desulfobacterales bacterium]|nr:MAG: carbon storage regulator [Desulfobacterales bacterium]